jgi:hypothetical protein
MEAIIDEGHLPWFSHEDWEILIYRDTQEIVSFSEKVHIQ